MSERGSVTHWIEQLKAGDRTAAQKLWERYFEKLLRLARARVRRVSRRMADEEDVVLSAFNSFFAGVEHGRFAKLDDRDNLLRLLLVITARKAHDLAQHERRQKRGGPGTADKPAQPPTGTTVSTDQALASILDRGPTPLFAAQVADECRRLLDCLDDEQQSVAVWKMEGYTNEEIAAKLGCAVATVERRLRSIRGAWEKDVDLGP